MTKQITYALKERIGHPSLFCGREREMNLLLGWAEKIPKEISKSRALVGRRKSGKTAIMQRLFNILWNRNGNVIPFYFEVLDQNQWVLDFSDKYIRTFLSQYLSFLTRIPLDTYNEAWSWEELENLNREVSNDNISKRMDTFRRYFEKGQYQQATDLAFGTPAWFFGRDKVFVVVMIDEIQYMTKYIFHDKDYTNVFYTLPGGFHGLVELKVAPMLVSGSYIGWMTQMIQERFVGGRLKWTPISSQLTFEEGMAAVFRYAEYHNMPVTERSALIINTLTQHDPFYISMLFGSDCPEKDFSSTEGVIHTLTHEIKDKVSELYKTWAEYIDSTIRQVNNIYAKKIMLFLSKERYKEWPRNEIREHIGWPPEKDRELEEKLATLEYGGLVTRGSSDFHYQGIQDDILDLIFRDRYQYEIEAVSPDISGELADKIKALEKEKKSLEGALSELKGRMLELVVWRELNKCRKENRTIKKFSGRLRELSDKTSDDQAEKMKSMAALCEKSRFSTVWMNYYIQLPHAPISEVDVLAEGEDEENVRALVFEIKNRGEKNLPTMKDAELFAEKVKRIKELPEQRNKTISFICPVYLSAEGFDEDIESWLHTQGIFTADMETWGNG